MTLNKATHKSLLFSLFFENGKEKRFALAKLPQASSLNKKLYEDAEKNMNDKGVLSSFTWEDKDLELSLDEASLAKELLNSIVEALPSQFEVITEMKELLK